MGHLSPQSHPSARTRRVRSTGAFRGYSETGERLELYREMAIGSRMIPEVPFSPVSSSKMEEGPRKVLSVCHSHAMVTRLGVYPASKFYESIIKICDRGEKYGTDVRHYPDSCLRDYSLCCSEAFANLGATVHPTVSKRDVTGAYEDSAILGRLRQNLRLKV